MPSHAFMLHDTSDGWRWSSGPTHYKGPVTRTLYRIVIDNEVNYDFLRFQRASVGESTVSMSQRTYEELATNPKRRKLIRYA